MIIPASMRLLLLVLAGVLPVWQRWFTTSADTTLRGLMMPTIDSLGVACVIVIARTRNPLVDGDPPPKVEIVNTPQKPVETHEADPVQPQQAAKTITKK